jgi:hypothetical protein
VSMGIISMAWLDKITVLGIMGAASGGFALLFWLRYSRFFILVEQFK